MSRPRAGDIHNSIREYDMNKLFATAFLLLLGSTIGLTGCETIEGAGQDIETVGESVQDAAENAKEQE